MITDLSHEIEPVTVPSRDEVGEVAAAFNAVNEVAVRVADGMYEMDDYYMGIAQEHGMEVIELTSEEKNEFISMVDSVYDLYINQYGGSQEIIDMATKYND